MPPTSKQASAQAVFKRRDKSVVGTAFGLCGFRLMKRIVMSAFEQVDRRLTGTGRRVRINKRLASLRERMGWLKHCDCERT
ncbi:MAG: hypothetical protein ACYSO7_05010 [Planctomycetota bacterium]